MINWEELKHIHVIKRLQEILANWFYVEIFFADEKGFLKNFEFGENGIFPIRWHIFLPRKRRYNLLCRQTAKAVEDIHKIKDTHMIAETPLARPRCWYRGYGMMTRNLGLSLRMPFSRRT